MRFLRTIPCLAFSALIAVGILACHTTGPSIAGKNFAPHYAANTIDKVVRPAYVLYNVTDSLTRLYFSVNAADLLYAKSNTGDVNFTARVILSYAVHPVGYSKVIVDSGHVVLKDVGVPGEPKQFRGSVDMDVTGNGKYYLEVSFRDINKMTVSYELLYLDHRGKDSRNNFLLTHAESQVPLFRTYVDSAELFSVRYYNTNFSKLLVRYYKSRSDLAPPPYAPERRAPALRPDSMWWIDLSPNTVLTLPREGWYTFNTDSTNGDGITVSRFHEGFPEVEVVRQLLYPLRYLTVREEYVAMDTAANTKKAVDKFWLDNTGSEERAREVIRNYYNRVEAANELFGTYKEGWKTDRGMIYLVFGPPQNVYRNIHAETWIYGGETGPGSHAFVFNRKESPFTDQEFILERNEEHKEPWLRAVNSWRTGHVYTLR